MSAMGRTVSEKWNLIFKAATHQLRSQCRAEHLALFPDFPFRCRFVFFYLPVVKERFFI